MTREEAIDVLEMVLKEACSWGLEERMNALDMAIKALQQDIVYCRDCKYYEANRCSEISYIMDGYYQGGFEVKKPNDFCSYGERREGK